MGIGAGSIAGSQERGSLMGVMLVCLVGLLTMELGVIGH
jgi:hypothetical protein